MPNVPLLSFNAGVLSPQIDARSDVAKYASGCRTLDNFIPRIYGSAERRPGTKFIGSVKDATVGKSRVVAFQFSDTIAYILEFGPEYIRFFFDGGRVIGAKVPTNWADDTAYIVGQFVTYSSVVYRCLVAHTSDATDAEDGTHEKPIINFTDWVVADLDDNFPIAETPTPYQESDLFELQFRQSADAMWIVHPNYAPRKLTRTTTTSFDLSTVSFTNGPFLPRNDLENNDDITITPSSTGDDSANFAASIEDGVAAESGASGTASGTVAETNDGDTTTFRKRRGHNTKREFGTWWSATSAMTITITFNVTATRLDEVKYWLGWFNNGTVTRTVSVSIKQGAVWTVIGTSTNNKVGILGSWTDVTAVRITLTNKSYWVGSNAYADCILYELEAWGTQDVNTIYKKVTLIASAPVFDSEHISAPGTLFKITHARATTETSGSSAHPTTGIIGSEIDIKGTFSFNTHGTWDKTVKLERNENSEGWETFRTFISKSDRNVQFTGNEEADSVQYRINVTSSTSGTLNADLTVNNSTESGICRIDTFVSSTEVTATILTNFASTDASKRWFEGAWSAFRGYPTAFTFFGGRAVYGGTSKQPQTVWFSETDDFENFEEGLNDADSFLLTMSSDKMNAIRWLSALDALLLGTIGGEWRIRATAIDEALSPTNFDERQQTSYGSKEIQPIPVGDAILFVDFVGRKIRELTFSDEKQKYVAPDLSALAEHITLTGITSLDYQRNPDAIVWSTLDNGKLLSMSYERDQDVIAWSPHPLGGTSAKAESVAVIPGTTEDEIWISTSRTVDGSTTRQIEQLQPRVDVDLEDAFFVDSGLVFDGGDPITITNVTQADPGVVSLANTNSDGSQRLQDGDQIYIIGVVGMTELNGNFYTVANSTKTTLTLRTFVETSSSPSSSLSSSPSASPSV